MTIRSREHGRSPEREVDHNGGYRVTAADQLRSLNVTATPTRRVSSLPILCWPWSRAATGGGIPIGLF